MAEIAGLRSGRIAKKQRYPSREQSEDQRHRKRAAPCHLRSKDKVRRHVTVIPPQLLYGRVLLHPAVYKETPGSRREWR
jgi:hypothetical protein